MLCRGADGPGSDRSRKGRPAMLAGCLRPLNVPGAGVVSVAATKFKAAPCQNGPWRAGRGIAHFHGYESLFLPTSSGRRRSRRECLVGRPRPPFVEGVENKLPQGVPRRGLVVRPTVAASRSLLPSFDLVCVRALPAGEPAEGRAFHARYSKLPPGSCHCRSNPHQSMCQRRCREGTHTPASSVEGLRIVCWTVIPWTTSWSVKASSRCSSEYPSRCPAKRVRASNLAQVVS
jgi:hypothetical protein